MPDEKLPAFTQSLYNKNYVTFPTGIARTDDQPLEKNTVFSSVKAAEEYAANNPTAYAGQIIAARQHSTANRYLVYVIQNDRTLLDISRCVFTYEFTKDKVKDDGKLWVFTDIAPKGIVNPKTGAFYSIGPDKKTPPNMYVLDISGINIPDNETWVVQC